MAKTLNARYEDGIVLLDKWRATCLDRLEAVAHGALSSEFYPDTYRETKLDSLFNTQVPREGDFRRAYKAFQNARDQLSNMRKERMAGTACHPLPDLRPVSAIGKFIGMTGTDPKWPAICGRAWCDASMFIDVSLFPKLGAVGRKLAQAKPHPDTGLGAHLDNIFARPPKGEHVPDSVVGACLYTDQAGCVITSGVGDGKPIRVEIHHPRFVVLWYIYKAHTDLRMTLTLDRGLYLRDAAGKVMVACMPIHHNRDRLDRLHAAWSQDKNATVFNLAERTP